MKPQATLVRLLFFVLGLHAVSSLKGKSPDEAPGVVLLDSITYRKVLPSCTANVMVLFLDKRQIGQPTTDGSRDNFLEVSRGMYESASSTLQLISLHFAHFTLLYFTLLNST